MLIALELKLGLSGLELALFGNASLHQKFEGAINGGITNAGIGFAAGFQKLVDREVLTLQLQKRVDDVFALLRVFELVFTQMVI